MSTMTIEGQVTLTGDQATDVIRHLNDRIKALEGRIALEQREATEQLSMRILDVLKYLRMHSVVLLYTGSGRAEDLVEQIQNETAVAALPQPVIDQVRAATLGGMNRF